MARKRNKNNRTPVVPERKSESLVNIEKNSLYASPSKMTSRGFGNSDIQDLSRIYSASLKKEKGIRPTLKALRAFADQLPAWSAITTIVDGVAQMAVEVLPPEELKDSKEALAVAKAIKKSIKTPNIDEQPTYRDFISAIVFDVLTGGVSTIERQKTENNPDHPIWMWVVDFDRIQLNSDWTPEREGLIPRYWDRGPNKTNNKDNWIPLLNQDLFCIRKYSNSWRLNCKSVMEVAFRLVAAWLGLFDFQEGTTSKATQEYLIDIGEATEKDLNAFREFFQVSVMENGEVPMFASRGSRGINVIKLGAANDEGLYLKYHEAVLRFIALAFKLTSRDMNIVEPDNKATANVSADASFQKAILPMSEIVIHSLQTEIVDRYYPGYIVRYIDTEPRSEKDEAETAISLYKEGLATKNESRVRSKLTNIGPEGDTYKEQGGTPGEEAAPGGEGMPPAPAGKKDEQKKEEKPVKPELAKSSK